MFRAVIKNAGLEDQSTIFILEICFSYQEIQVSRPNVNSVTQSTVSMRNGLPLPPGVKRRGTRDEEQRGRGLPAARPGPGAAPRAARTSRRRRAATCRSPASARRPRGTVPTGGAAGGRGAPWARRGASGSAVGAGAGANAGPGPTRGRAPRGARRPGGKKSRSLKSSGPGAEARRGPGSPSPAASGRPCLLRRAGRPLAPAATGTDPQPRGRRGSGCAGLDGNWRFKDIKHESPSPSS